MSAAPAYKVTPFTPAGPLPPLDPADFARQDAAVDTAFYSTPRFVTHIDDAAIAALRAYFDAVLPTRQPGSSRPPRILDFCSSWISHYPPRLEAAAAAGDVAVVGLGLNAAELQRNDLLNAGRVVRDLNTQPVVDASTLGLAPGDQLDALTCTVSIDYLTAPADVLRSLRKMTRPGGTVHLAISNRCFPTKAVRRWLHANEDARLELCAEDLWRAGWREVEIVEVASGVADDLAQPNSQLARLMATMGVRAGGDPLWVVRGTNTGEP